MYYSEAENISGWATCTNDFTARASNGYCARLGSYTKLISLEPGIYKVYVRAINGSQSAGGSISVRVGTTEEGITTVMESIPSGTNNLANTDDITITSTSDLYILCNGGNDKGLDWVYIQKTGVAGTLANTYSTLASAYGLDFAHASASIGTLTAYAVTGITASTITLTSVSELPANSGVILKGTAAATYAIPIKATAAYDGTNLLKAAVTAKTLDDGSFYILKNGEFHLVTGAADEAARTVPAGKAYLLATDVPSGARALTFAFGDDESTGISTVKAGGLLDGEFYNLQGQRVDAPKSGLYIVNGKKVIIK